MYWLDLTPNLHIVIPVKNGFKIVEKNIKPDIALTLTLNLRKQGLDVLVFPASVKTV
jgi:hypothetical protein